MGLIVDLFAGGGGASLGIERALGRFVDVAVNHDREAVALHQRNHPYTRHFVEDVWQVDPLEATGGQSVDLLWASPDCKHFSKARGGAPVSKRVRSLAWVVVKWAGKVRPDVILMENVEEFVTWGPLVMKRGADGQPLLDPKSGHPVMIPDPKRRGQIFRAWVKHLQRLGYVVEWRELVAADYGAPTTRKRLFIVARCDGRPIVWPEPTHADTRLPPEKRRSRKAWRSAASIIDWSLPCPSIFLTREEGRAQGVNRPLADKTMARIAKGVRRYVLDHPAPFIVPITHGGGFRGRSGRHPVPTITTANRGELALVTPFLGSHYGSDGGHCKAADTPVPTVTTRGTQNQVIAPVLVPRYGEREGQEPRARDPQRPMPAVVPTGNGASLVAPILQKYHGARRETDARGVVPSEPVPTTDTSNRVSLVAAFLAQHNTDMVGHEAREPMSTIVGKGCTQAVVAAHLMTNTSGHAGRHPDEPVATATTGQHQSVVAAFLQSYYSSGGQDADPRQPMPTVVATARHAPVTVILQGRPYVVVDIGMRMFSPRELYRAQGFPDSYVIDAGLDGRWLTKSAQIRMCGNSVCPDVAAALATANAAHLRRLVGEAAE